MKEIGIVNRELSRLLSEQGHGDLLMVVDAGFAIPKSADVVDISLTENCPMVIDTLRELKKFFSVEKLIFADKTKEVSPSLFDNITKLIGEDVKGRYADLKQASADRCPRLLGTFVKPPEVQYHHEVYNQYLWNQF